MKNSIEIKSNFQINHLIKYLNDFINISVNKIEWKDNLAYISFSDKSTYSMSEEIWHKIQQNVDRLYINYKMTH